MFFTEETGKVRREALSTSASWLLMQLQAGLRLPQTNGGVSKRESWIFLSESWKFVFLFFKFYDKRALQLYQ